MMATEGFGPKPMNGDALALLAEVAGREAVVLTATHVAGPLTRPELIVSDEAALDDEARTSTAVLVSGARVRLVAQADLGTSGMLVREPSREPFGDRRRVDVVGVELARGGRRAVPVANVEVIS